MPERRLGDIAWPGIRWGYSMETFLLGSQRSGVCGKGNVWRGGVHAPEVIVAPGVECLGMVSKPGLDWEA
jgi:hypothetical protein